MSVFVCHWSLQLLPVSMCPDAWLSSFHELFGYMAGRQGGKGYFGSLATMPWFTVSMGRAMSTLVHPLLWNYCNPFLSFSFVSLSCSLVHHQYLWPAPHPVMGLIPHPSQKLVIPFCCMSTRPQTSLRTSIWDYKLLNYCSYCYQPEVYPSLPSSSTPLTILLKQLHISRVHPSPVQQQFLKCIHLLITFPQPTFLL